jgi:hypothetical protein
MNAETRTLLLVFGVLGVFSCCCMCVPVSLYVFSPAIIRVQQAAAQAQMRQAQQQARKQNPFPPPQITPPARVPVTMQPRQPPMELPEIRLDPELPPAATPPPALVPKIKLRPEGYASLSEIQRKSIYRSATMADRVKESMGKQEAQMRSRGMDTSMLRKMIADQDARQETERQRLADRYKLSSDELDKIIKEGRDKSW